MTDRRSFCSAVSAAGVWLSHPKLLKPCGAALRVDATPTVFFSNPDGAANLVRFQVSGIDAPAGRLRVFDRSRRLLGTAGLLRTGETLYGELWMQLESATSVVSELEAPGVRGPFRTRHRLVPERRWTIHLLTLADPDTVAGKLSGLMPIHRAAQTLVYRNSFVGLNPLPFADDMSRLEHVPFLRMAERAMKVERDFAIPMGTVAYLPTGVYLPKTGAKALVGAGIRVLTRQQLDGNPFEWWSAPGGARILVVSVPDGSTPEALGFDKPQSETVRRVEGWLSTTALRFSPDDTSGTAVVLNSDADTVLTETLAGVSEWNSRFAYPRVIVGDDSALFREMESSAMNAKETEPAPIHQPHMPDGIELTSVAAARSAQVTQRTHNLERVFSQVVTPGRSSLEAVAARVATTVTGTLVFNPSPYSNSQLMHMTDGIERLASDVPGLGYAFFPDEKFAGNASRWDALHPTYSVEGAELRVTIDRASGGIASLVQLNSGRDWARQNSGGLNSIDGTRLVGVAVSRLAGVGTRLVVSRRSPSLGMITTTVMLYDALPWLDLTNETERIQPSVVPCQFELAASDPKVSWEIPAGSDEAPAPVQRLEHLRWIRVEDADGSLLLRGLDAPIASVERTGAVTSFAPTGASRYRIAPLPRYSSPDDPWVFGWNSEPMTTVRCEPDGTDVLPRFGEFLAFEQVGLSVLGISPADDGYGAIVYLQETLGVSRSVSVGPAVLRFRHAEKVDFLERYIEEIPVGADGFVEVPMPAHGVVALRLSGLELS